MRGREKRLIVIIFIAVLSCAAILVPNASAHRSGCHRWHSCPSDSGSYVCGDLGYSNYCGASTYVAPQPIITTKDEVIEEPIAFKEIEKENPNEYVGHRKLLEQGESGVQRKSVEVTYTDGWETARSTAETTEVKPAKHTVYEVGTRVRPTAYIDYLYESNKQGFWSFLAKEYDISASAVPREKFALIKNGKVIRLATSSKEGMLDFDNIGLKGGDVLEIGTYEGGQFLWFMPAAKSISEKHTVNTDNEEVISEYDRLHNKKSDRTDESRPVLECTESVRKAYLDSLNDTDKRFVKPQEVQRIYYTEVPCDITLKSS